MIILLACSSENISELEDPAVRQVRFALGLVRRVAQSGVRNWRNRAEELRLSPRIQRLLETVSKANHVMIVDLWRFIRSV